MAILANRIGMLPVGLLLVSGLFSTGCAAPLSAAQLSAKKIEQQKKDSLAQVTRMDSIRGFTPGTKEQFSFTKGDCTLTVGGEIRVESYFDKNMNMLNKHIPDELEYFKETVDLTFDVAYGKQKYGFNAAEFYADMRHKGVWGKGLSYADQDTGPLGPSNIKFGDSSSLASFGSHSHISGKSLLWLKEAWLMFSPSAPISSQTSHVHTLKMGWFPYQFGRGIALSSFYGINKEFLGLFTSYVEEKSAPGILWSGVIVKDLLTYDLYYSKFEERNKSIGDTFNLVKINIVPDRRRPWRGEAKDNDLFASRLKITPLKPGHSCGHLEFEPYVFYNAASDQRVEFNPDSKVNWGSYGMAVEHTCGNFEWGAEAAFNYGKEKVFNLDRNIAKIVNTKVYGSPTQSQPSDIFAIQEVYSHIYNKVPTDPTKAQVPVYGSPATPWPLGGSRYAAVRGVINGDGTSNNGQEILLSDGTHTGMWSADDRFRPAYYNRFAGWMCIIDGAYKVEKWNLKVASVYGYASGDNNPNAVARNKTYNGFVGLHELYNGKRVKSLILDERLLRRPLSLVPGQRPSAKTDISISDLQHVGVGLTWTPKCCLKDLSINPNVIMFWKAYESYKFIQDPNIRFEGGYVSPTEKARSFMGVEYNLFANFKPLTDLKMFINTAVFVPGGFFKDVKGVPLDGDILRYLTDSDDNTTERIIPSFFRLSDNTAFHLNIGFDFKF